MVFSIVYINVDPTGNTKICLSTPKLKMAKLKKKTVSVDLTTNSSKINVFCLSVEAILKELLLLWAKYRHLKRVYLHFISNLNLINACL